jgi:hypothetical protein
MRRLLLVSAALAVSCTPLAPSTTTPSPSGSAPAVTATPSPSASAAVACPAFRQISPGAISGKFGYPAEGVPPLALIAVRADDPNVYRVVHTKRVEASVTLPSYTIAAVEPGTYVVLAYVEGSSAQAGQAGAYTPAVACGLHATCADHSLIRVTVRGGQDVTGIDVLDWYAPQGTFPARPAGSEPFRTNEGLRVCNPYADSVNLRASAGLGFPVRRTLDNGASVAVRDGPLPADGYDWYEVNLAGDPLASGWVVAHALRR